MKKYDTENRVYYRVEFCVVEEVAEMGDFANFSIVTIPAKDYDEKKIEQYAKEHGFNTVEVTKITEDTDRYYLEV